MCSKKRCPAETSSLDLDVTVQVQKEGCGLLKFHLVTGSSCNVPQLHGGVQKHLATTVQVKVNRRLQSSPFQRYCSLHSLCPVLVEYNGCSRGKNEFASISLVGSGGRQQVGGVAGRWRSQALMIFTSN